MGRTRRPKRDKVALPREGKPEDNELKFRLRPQRPKASRQGDMAWSIALKTVYRYARKSGRPGSAPGICRLRLFETAELSTSAVWFAARQDERPVARAGFGHAVAMWTSPRRSGEWQESGDERLWKIIISPEFGERLDLERLTRDIVKQAERELGTPPERVAVKHFNREHRTSIW